MFIRNFFFTFKMFCEEADTDRVYLIHGMVGNCPEL